MPYAIAAWLIHQRPERKIPTALAARQPCTGRTGGGRRGIWFLFAVAPREQHGLCSKSYHCRDLHRHGSTRGGPFWPYLHPLSTLAGNDPSFFSTVMPPCPAPHGLDARRRRYACPAGGRCAPHRPTHSPSYGPAVIRCHTCRPTSGSHPGPLSQAVWVPQGHVRGVAPARAWRQRQHRTARRPHVTGYRRPQNVGAYRRIAAPAGAWIARLQVEARYA